MKSTKKQLLVLEINKKVIMIQNCRVSMNQLIN